MGYSVAVAHIPGAQPMSRTCSRRRFLRFSIASGLAVAVPRLFAAGAAEALYARATVIDGLGFPGGLDGEDEGLGDAEVAHLAESGLSATHLTVGQVGTMAPLAAFEQIVRDVARWDGEIAAHPDVLAAVRRVADIEPARRAGRVGLIYGLQDGVAFEDDPERLDALAHLGIERLCPPLEIERAEHYDRDRRERK